MRGKSRKNKAPAKYRGLSLDASAPGFGRRDPRTFRNANLTAADLAAIPPDADITLNGHGAAKLATYF